MRDRRTRCDDAPCNLSRPTEPTRLTQSSPCRSAACGRLTSLRQDTRLWAGGPTRRTEAGGAYVVSTPRAQCAQMRHLRGRRGPSISSTASTSRRSTNGACWPQSTRPRRSGCSANVPA
ncbi:hypothetical protein [Streptomyces nigra]|uniref:hypothetical protein n=1 Tax=Streptomyces nigra TaxID=1827580 RepID=UPI00371BDBAE